MTSYFKAPYHDTLAKLSTVSTEPFMHERLETIQLRLNLFQDVKDHVM